MSYTIIHKYSNQHSHINFKGEFQGKTVLWDTHFFTLNAYNAAEESKDITLKQFIEINLLESAIMKLTVVLKINEVNDANIKKMMIMINQYKNLSLGRHVYG